MILKGTLSNRYVLLCLFKKIISQCSRIECDNCAIITKIVTIHHKTANLLIKLKHNLHIVIKEQT